MRREEVARLRGDTPGCRDHIHLHHSGAGLMPRQVLQAVKDHLDLEARIGGYEAAAAAAEKTNFCYVALAHLLNCQATDIALLENATVAWQLAFYGWMQQCRPGDKILIAEAEYGSSYTAYLHARQLHNIEIVTVPNDAKGQIDVTALEAAIDDRVKLISLVHVPTSGGLVNPAVAVGDIARRHGITYLLDACQSVGQVPVDVAAIGCDLLSATGRKFLRGPRGTGFLYVRPDFQQRILPAMLDMRGAPITGPETFTLRSDARRFENWENYVAGYIGLGVAVDLAVGLGLSAIWQRVQMLAGQLRRGLTDIPDLQLRDQGEEQCGIVSFTHPAIDPPKLQQWLYGQGIAIGISDTGSSPLDMAARQMTGLCRPSVHYYNEEDEIDRFLQMLQRYLSPSIGDE